MSPTRRPPPPRHVLSRRASLLTLAPLLQPSVLPASAFFGGDSPLPRVQLLSSPEICQGRCKEQDFVVVRYVGRFADGSVFDKRYSSRPLTYELGSFYLPGIDDGLDGACVGSKFKFSWARGPNLGEPYASVLPPDSNIEVELELLSIRYSLFGEKMRNASSTYWFTEQPLTLTSAADFERGHQDRGKEVVVEKDNPFSVAPGEKSLISNPSSSITNLFTGWFTGFPTLPSLPF